MSRFPKLSETFILNEMIALKKEGFEIEVFPLIKQREAKRHPEVDQFLDNTHYLRLFSMKTLAAQIYWLWRNPFKYLGVWIRIIVGNSSSFKMLSRSLVVMLKASSFARSMRALEVDHIHAHWATHPTLGAYIVHRLAGIPYSFTAHAHDIYVERAMLREKIESAQFVATISDYNKQFLKNLYGDKHLSKIIIVRCGIDTEFFKPKENSQKDERVKFTIVCVGSLEEKKGHRFLIEACSILRLQGMEFQCLLVGDGDKRAELETLIEQNNLTDDVHLLGWQTRQQIRELIGSANVMVLPSITTSTGKQEGIPVALMEALAMQVPAIATQISGIPELIEDNNNGLLVTESDARAIADAISRLYSDPVLQNSLGVEGRKKVQEEFDLQKNVFKLGQLITASISRAETASP